MSTREVPFRQSHLWNQVPDPGTIGGNDAPVKVWHCVTRAQAVSSQSTMMNGKCVEASQYVIACTRLSVLPDVAQSPLRSFVCCGSAAAWCTRSAATPRAHTIATSAAVLYKYTALFLPRAPRALHSRKRNCTFP